jgi:hypothetical protein
MQARMHLPAATRVATSFAAVALSTLVATTALAQGTPASWRGFYAGGGGNYSTVSVEVGGNDCYDYYDCYYWWGDMPTYDEGDGDYSFSGHIGYRINQWFAIEASYIDAGTIGWNDKYVWMPELAGFYRNNVEFSSTIPEVGVLAILPFFERWEAYFKLGAGFWDGTSKQKLTNEDTGQVTYREVDDSGTDYMVGVGLGYSFATAWHVRFDFQSVGLDGDVLNVRDDSSIDTMQLELQYRFGAQKAATVATPAAPVTTQPESSTAPVQ